MSLDRALAAFRVLVREMLSPDASDAAPVWAYWVCWEYSVSEATDTTFTGRATSSRCPHPDLVGVPLMPGIGGALIKPAVGSRVCVVFVNGDPGRPTMVQWDQAFAQHVALQAAASAQVPTALTVDVAPAGVKVFDAANSPPAQAVALAPAVSSFAGAQLAFEAAVTAFTTAMAAFVANPAVTALATTEAAAVATAAGALVTATASYTSAVGALIGTFPTGFTATKLSTQ